jgi:hypothetical protein
MESAGFPEGAVIATPDTVYVGFRFEGISDAAYITWRVREPGS